MRLQDKVAIVTGGGQGIGEGIAKVFASEGAAVVVAARSQDKIEKVAEEISEAGGRAKAVKTDIREPEQVKNLVNKTIKEFSYLNILLNNAGIPSFGHRIDEPLEKILPRFDNILKTNIRGSWLNIHFAVPYMKKAGGGSIIQIGSVHGKLGAPKYSAYGASKGALDAMTRDLAIELAAYNIRVNNCNPGLIDVSKKRLMKKLKEEGKEEKARQVSIAYQESCKGNQPLNLVGRPEDIAYACVYLASDESRYVTGTTLMVDGGSTALLGEPRNIDEKSFTAQHEFSKLMNNIK